MSLLVQLKERNTRTSAVLHHELLSKVQSLPELVGVVREVAEVAEPVCRQQPRVVPLQHVLWDGSPAVVSSFSPHVFLNAGGIYEEEAGGIYEL